MAESYDVLPPANGETSVATNISCSSATKALLCRLQLPCLWRTWNQKNGVGEAGMRRHTMAPLARSGPVSGQSAQVVRGTTVVRWSIATQTGHRTEDS